MALISVPFVFSAGAVIVASEHNSNFSTIYNEFNGNIDNNNLKSSAAIVDTKLATITSAGKVNISALTVASQATGDLIYASGATTWVRRAIGSANDIAVVAGGVPTWAAWTSLFLTPKEYTDVVVTDASDRTTTSSTYGDITGVTSTFTVGKAGLVHVNFSGQGISTSGIGYFAIVVNTVVKNQACITSGATGPVNLGWSGVLTAASHTIKIQQKNTDNSSTQTLKGTVQASTLLINHPA